MSTLARPNVYAPTCRAPNKADRRETRRILPFPLSYYPGNRWRVPPSTFSGVLMREFSGMLDESIKIGLFNPHVH